MTGYRQQLLHLVLASLHAVKNCCSLCCICGLSCVMPFGRIIGQAMHMQCAAPCEFPYHVHTSAYFSSIWPAGLHAFCGRSHHHPNNAAICRVELVLFICCAAAALSGCVMCSKTYILLKSCSFAGLHACFSSSSDAQQRLNPQLQAYGST